MADNIIHNQGGTTNEQYMLSFSAYLDATRLSTPYVDGLMPASVYAQSERVTAPVHSTSYGLPGQWALDASYTYYCTANNTWQRLPLTTFESVDASSSSSSCFDISSSSSSSSNNTDPVVITFVLYNSLDVPVLTITTPALSATLLDNQIHTININREYNGTTIYSIGAQISRGSLREPVCYNPVIYPVFTGTQDFNITAMAVYSSNFRRWLLTGFYETTGLVSIALRLNQEELVSSDENSSSSSSSSSSSRPNDSSASSLSSDSSSSSSSMSSLSSNSSSSSSPSSNSSSSLSSLSSNSSSSSSPSSNSSSSLSSLSSNSSSSSSPSSNSSSSMSSLSSNSSSSSSPSSNSSSSNSSASSPSSMSSMIDSSSSSSSSMSSMSSASSPSSMSSMIDSSSSSSPSSNSSSSKSSLSSQSQDDNSSSSSSSLSSNSSLSSQSQDDNSSSSSSSLSSASSESSSSSSSSQPVITTGQAQFITALANNRTITFQVTAPAGTTLNVDWGTTDPEGTYTDPAGDSIYDMTGNPVTISKTYSSDYYIANQITFSGTGCGSILNLDCSGNGLANMLITGLTELRTLDASDNLLSSFDISANTKLTALNLANNLIIGALDVLPASIESINISDNYLTSVDVSGLINLNNINCSFNAIASLNVTGAVALNNITAGMNALGTTSLDALLTELVSNGMFEGTLNCPLYQPPYPGDDGLAAIDTLRSRGWDIPLIFTVTNKSLAFDITADTDTTLTIDWGDGEYITVSGNGSAVTVNKTYDQCIAHIVKITGTGTPPVITISSNYGCDVNYVFDENSSSSSSNSSSSSQLT